MRAVPPGFRLPLFVPVLVPVPLPVSSHRFQFALPVHGAWRTLVDKTSAARQLECWFGTQRHPPRPRVSQLTTCFRRGPGASVRAALAGCGAHMVLLPVPVPVPLSISRIHTFYYY